MVCTFNDRMEVRNMLKLILHYLLIWRNETYYQLVRTPFSYHFIRYRWKFWKKNDLNVLEGRGFARYEFQYISVTMGTILLKIPPLFILSVLSLSIILLQPLYILFLVYVPSSLPRVSWLRMGGLTTDGMGMGFVALAVETSYWEPV